MIATDVFSELSPLQRGSGDHQVLGMHVVKSTRQDMFHKRERERERGGGRESAQLKSPPRTGESWHLMGRTRPAFMCRFWEITTVSVQIQSRETRHLNILRRATDNAHVLLFCSSS